MKNDLDTMMIQQGLAGILVLGNGFHNPPMVYLTGGGHFSAAILAKKAGAAPLMCVNPMEREEADKSGFEICTFNDFNYFGVLKELNGDQELAEAKMIQMTLEKAGILEGKVALMGIVELGGIWKVLHHLQVAMPKVELISTGDQSVLSKARIIKDAIEMERIIQMGKVTAKVVGRVAEFLQTRPVREETLFLDGKPLTVADVKSRINLWLAEEGAENPEDTIFSIGRDAGIGHSSGTPTDEITLGKTICFDIYPCEKGGGYFYDFTRTWCLGYAPEPAQTLYNQVKEVYDAVVKELKSGGSCIEYQKLTCDLFEKMGHPTIQSTPNTTDGYNHSLGHGLGLDVHEKPWFGALAGSDDVLGPGMVFTIEPGLYYPEKGMGVRIEDTYYVGMDGSIQKCVDFPMDLILPMKG